jgi:hypothetical protein
MTELVPRTFPDLDKCVNLNKTRFDIEYLKQFDAIVINVLFGWYLPEELNRYTTFLKELGVKKVVVFGGYFETKSELPVLINEFGFNENKILEDMISTSETDPVLQEATNDLGYLYISKKKSLCILSDCSYWKSGIPFTWDSHHLSFEFAESLLKEQKNEVNSYLGNGKSY